MFFFDQVTQTTGALTWELWPSVWNQGVGPDRSVFLARLPNLPWVKIGGLVIVSHGQTYCLISWTGPRRFFYPLTPPAWMSIWAWGGRSTIDLEGRAGATATSRRAHQIFRTLQSTRRSCALSIDKVSPSNCATPMEKKSLSSPPSQAPQLRFPLLFYHSSNVIPSICVGSASA